MSDETAGTGIWFVYDGECPLCSSAAQAMRIKKQYGALYLIDARKAGDNPLIEQINAKGLDLDEGMVIYTGGRFCHGADALKFMAKYGDATNAFMRIAKIFFWSDALAALFYPWLRGVRNALLRHKGIGRINNIKGASNPE